MDGGNGTVDDDHRWRASPGRAVAIRLLAVAVPVVSAVLVLLALKDALLRPDGAVGAIVWIAEAAVIGLAVGVLVDRFTRRLLPLATLYDLSLTFPGPAPSRLEMASRVATSGRRGRRIAEVLEGGLGDDPVSAAPTGLEMVLALAARDRLAPDHTARVCHWADLLAREVGLSESERDQVAWGVVLHDIGKIAVPIEILNKPGRPTPQEWEVLRRHPALGADLLGPLDDWMGDWYSAAAEHHERWDGTGYPAGLEGEAISLAGRITSVADAFAVITARTSYERGITNPAARQEMLRCAGTQFDPALVRLLLSIPPERV